MRVRLLLLVCLGLMVPSVGFAEELLPDTKYQGPVTLEVPSYGVSFKLPKGWMGFLSGDYFLVGAEEFPGFISMGAEKMTVKEVVADFAKTQDLGDGFKMRPKSKPKAKGNLIHVDVEVTDGAQVSPGLLRAVIGKYGVGVVMGTVGVGEAFKKIKPVALAIEKSLTFVKPQGAATPRAATPAEANPDIHRCWQHSSSATSGGYTNIKVALYADGTYQYRYHMALYSEFGTVNDDRREEGTYQIKGGTLVRHPNGAESYSSNFRYDGTFVYIGSDKYFPCE